MFLWFGRLLALVAIMLPHVPFCILLSETTAAQAQPEPSTKKLCPCCSGHQEESSNPENKTPIHDCPAQLPCHYCTSFNFAPSPQVAFPIGDNLAFEPVISRGFVRFVDGYPSIVERPPRPAC